MKLNKINDIILNRIDSKIINKKEELEFLEKRLKNNEILKKKIFFINYYIEQLKMEMILKHSIIDVIILMELYQL